MVVAEGMEEYKLGKNVKNSINTSTRNNCLSIF